jgi:hypothetical protein
LASRHDRDTVYAAFNHYQRGDFKPYLYRSGNRGGSWESIAGDLITVVRAGTRIAIRTATDLPPGRRPRAGKAASSKPGS